VEGILDRPLVNEYTEVLWAALSRLWPALQRRERQFRLLVSHDVDWPYCTAGRGLSTTAGACLGDLWDRRSPALAARRLVSFVRTRGTRPDSDLCNTFDLLMDLSEREGVRSVFYFIAGHTAGQVDGIYRLTDPWIVALLRRIQARGHEIGLHPSYNTYRDSTQLAREYSALREAATSAGIVQNVWGGRQHFLRWEAPTTWENYEAAGLDYDCTLGFAERPGFRCGTCWEYPVFSLRTGALRLRERPLIVMDASLLERWYLNLSAAAALEIGYHLLDRCRRFRGDFTLLWHNSQLLLPAHRAVYTRLLERGARPKDANLL
jgi:peptidoglycan/xylan/chitin deacetylase (PgdA/CDA1 family)